MFNKWLVALTLSFSSFSSLAFSPTAEQLQLLQNLSSSEKQALLKQYAPDVATEQQEVEREIETVKPLREPMQTSEQELSRDEKSKLFEKKKPLQPFGKFLFAGEPTTFAPVNSVPVPTDYMLGTGDQLRIQVFGSKNESYQVVIDRNGRISLPNIGPVTLSGMPFSEAKVLLKDKLKALGVGVNSSITMGELRSFRIFVLGESRTPGSYLVSGMASMTHALYVSGGLTDIASYRNIQLKRRGKLIKRLDLYDLLLKGDTSGDARLQPGDTVFIPKRKMQIAIRGEVLKPALYELKVDSPLHLVLKLAGDVASNAYTKSIQVSRIVSPEVRQNFSLDLHNAKDRKFSIKDGDEILVQKVTAEASDLIKVRGEVALESEVSVDNNTRLLDVLSSRKQFTNDADLKALLIKRQSEVAGSYQILQANWLAAVAEPESEQNILLQPRDEVIVLSYRDDEQRRDAVNIVLDELNKQESESTPSPKVTIHGSVKFVGQYPLTQAMTVADLVTLSGGLHASAMLTEVELVRYDVVEGERRQIQNIVVDLNKALRGDAKHNLKLQDYDAITVKRVTDWEDAASVVVLNGEVAYPGEYVIKPGDTLESVLVRAGGFTQWAAPQNSIFTREALKERERVEMDAMANELEKSLLFSLKSGSAQDVNSQTMVSLGQSLVEKVKETPALGRLVIGLNPEVLNKYQATLQLELRDGDILTVPKRSNEIVIMGEVARTASMLYQQGLSVEDYLLQSGGLTKRADEDSIYIVHGDGSIEPYKSSMFMSSKIALKPGDTIVVPMDVERVSPIVTWTAVTKILSNLAVTAATLQTLGVIN